MKRALAGRVGRLYPGGEPRNLRSVNADSEQQDRITNDPASIGGVAIAVLVSGVAAAQTYPPAPPPGTIVMPVPPPAPIVPPPAVPRATSSTTTTVAPSPNGDHREVTIHKEVDEIGKTVTKKETHQEGVSGSTETHHTRYDQEARVTGRTRILFAPRSRRSRSGAVAVAADHDDLMADGVGFEPTVPLRARRFSRPVP